MEKRLSKLNRKSMVQHDLSDIYHGLADVFREIITVDDGVMNATEHTHAPRTFRLRTPDLPTLTFLRDSPTLTFLSTLRPCIYLFHRDIAVPPTTGDHHAVRTVGARVPQPRQPQEGPHGCLPPPLRADAPSRIRSETPPGQREQPPCAAAHPQVSDP